ncbi:MAG: hypothetical protein ACM3JD_19405, partial [Rudaea sp.]
MPCVPESTILNRLKNRINLEEIPFSDAGSRLLLFRNGNSLRIRLAERWYKWESEVGNYRVRPPILDDWVVTDASGNAMPFTLTTYPHALCLETPAGEFWLAFADEETLYVRL